MTHRTQLSLVSALKPAFEMASQSIPSNARFAELADACDNDDDEEEEEEDAEAREEAISALPILRLENAAEEEEAARTSVLVKFASKLPPLPNPLSLPLPLTACFTAAELARTFCVDSSSRNDLRSEGEWRRRGEEGEAGVKTRPQSVSRRYVSARCRITSIFAT